jgi:Ca-activated chloride channel family protein
MPDGRNLTDNTGETVISRLNEEMCKDIAKAGSGTYIHVDNTSQAQQKLEDEISKMQKGETETVIYSEYDEQFQAVALLALLLLVIETIVRESINPRLKNLRIFKRKTDL